MKKEIELKIVIPGLLYKALSTNLEFAIKDISNTKSRNSFKNAYWAISAFLINECCYDNDNLDFFVNIHKDNFIKISGIDLKKITVIKDWLIKISGIFECNFNHCNSGPVNYSYGYRLSPGYHYLFNQKRTSLNEDNKEISFSCSEKFLQYRYCLDIDTLNSFKRRNSRGTVYYIKRDNDSQELVDNEQVITFFTVKKKNIVVS